MFILDSDHLSILEWEDSEPSRRLQGRLDRYPVEEICTTIVSFEEQTRGWLGLLAKSKKHLDQIEIYRRLQASLRNYCGMTVLAFDAIAATHLHAIRKSRPRMGTMDAKIAAIALAHQATLLSRNLRDFHNVPGLNVEDWTGE